MTKVNVFFFYCEFRWIVYWHGGKDMSDFCYS